MFRGTGRPYIRSSDKCALWPTPAFIANDFLSSRLHKNSSLSFLQLIEVQKKQWHSSHFPLAVAASFASHGTRSASGCCFEPCLSSSRWRQCQPPPKISCQWTRLALHEGTVQDKLFRFVFLPDCSPQRVINHARAHSTRYSYLR